MGFFFRKSFRLTRGLRINLSKSGVGLSAGVKGARIGLGPRGASVSGGKDGIYFRQSLGGKTGGRPGSLATVIIAGAIVLVLGIAIALMLSSKSNFRFVW